MPTPVHEIRVFMASPGDLGDEREALRGVERRINAAFRGRGLRISVSGWEEVQPELGRPQALINPLVNECEVFIGLLNLRWGSATGTHDSGFAEEFDLALARREHGDEPAIGMFFRVIDEDRLEDKGPQLLAVLAFQERVRQEHLALYKTFETVDQLSFEVFDFLTQIALRVLGEVEEEPKTADSGSRGTDREDIERASLESAGPDEPDPYEEPTKTGDPQSDLDSAQRQIVAALTDFTGLYSGVRVSEETRDRVTLVGSAFAVDDCTLGTHHVNRLFRGRDALQLTLGEFQTWLRTYFLNVSGYTPGDRTVPIWGVVEDFDSGFLEQLGVLVHDRDTAVARGVLRTLTRHKIRVEALWGEGTPDSRPDREPALDDLASGWASLFAKFAGIDAAMNHLVALATVNDISLLNALADSDKLGEPSQNLVRAFIALLQGDMTDVRRLAPPKYSSTDTEALRSLLVEAMPRLTREQCEDMLGSHPSLAAAAARELVQDSELSEAQLKAIIGLDDPTVSAAMVARASEDSEWAYTVIRLLRGLNAFSHADLIARLLAASVPLAGLEALALEEEYDVSYWTAATIKDPDRAVAASREILDGHSSAFVARAEELKGDHPSLASYVLEAAAAAACKALASATEFDGLDVVRVVKELRKDRSGSREAALQALVLMATRGERDPTISMPDLGDLSVLDHQWARFEKDLIVSSPLIPLIAPMWRLSTIGELRSSAAAWALRQPSSSDEELEETLYDDDSDLRMVALEELLTRWHKDRLEALLGRYDQQGRPYWYNIIATLDEHLYGLASGKPIAVD